MKVIAALCMVGSTYAGIKDMMRLAENIKRSALNSSDASVRSFGSAWGQKIIEGIDGYACWCYFQDDHGKGRGKPVNEMDARCKVLQDGYTCIMMDADDEGNDNDSHDDGCVPWDVEYNSASGLGVSATDPDNSNFLYAIRRGCDRNNKHNACAHRSCKVEGYFVVNMFLDYLNAVSFDPSLKHDLGIFHPKDDCPIDGGDRKSGKECCGEYPIRFPYKHLDGDRGCCGQRTFNALVLQCCANGKVKAVC